MDLSLVPQNANQNQTAVSEKNLLRVMEVMSREVKSEVEVIERYRHTDVSKIEILEVYLRNILDAEIPEDGDAESQRTVSALIAAALTLLGLIKAAIQPLQLAKVSVPTMAVINEVWKWIIVGLIFLYGTELAQKWLKKSKKTKSKEQIIAAILKNVKK